jgi:hypothetical protein
MAEEKRKYLRFECFVPVDSLKFEGETPLADKGTLEDISREGGRLVLDLDTALKPGANLDFRLQSVENDQPYSVTGEIVWSQSKEKRLQVGLKIKKMDKRAKSELLDLGYLRWCESHKNKKKNP